EFYNGWKKGRREMPLKHAQLTARTFEHVLKIAIIYAILSREHELTVESLAATAICIGQWLGNNMLKAFLDTGLDRFGKCERSILDQLKRARENRMWRRNLQQVMSARGFNGDIFSRALKALEDNDLVLSYPVKSNSGRYRPVVVLCV